MTTDDLRQRIEAGEVDTVLTVFADMQGRLQGKRMHARYFLNQVLDHGTEGCNYLLTVDVEMNTIDGYGITSWETGYGDMMFELDLDTIRPVPWLPGTAMVFCDLTWMDGTPVNPSPRQILRVQADRAAALGFEAFAGTELEFIVFDDSYEQAWDAGYRGLTPSNRYNIDYSILGGSRVEPLLRDIRNNMYEAGMTVEGTKGECNPGQHETTFLFDRVITTCDQHAIYKNGSKEIASLHGKSITFMAKYNKLEGNSCHIHLSLRGQDGAIVFGSDESGDGHSELFNQFVAGTLATMREFTLMYAPNINSYKRFQRGSFAPTTVAWGRDNRTCSVRVVGHGASLRMENRLPGGDVNPYMAIAAMLAGGMHGIENKLKLEPALEGNAYTSDKPTVPVTLADARELFAQSTIARKAFGDDVVDHYVKAADVEIEAFNAAITDWELTRGFERL